MDYASEEEAAGLLEARIMRESPVSRTGVSGLEFRDSPFSKKRNLCAFWVLGLCNNFGYVVMLSAAKDILDKFDVDDYAESHEGNHVPFNETACTPESAGAILLADIVPALIVKLCGPFINVNTHFQVAAVAWFSAAGFLLTALASKKLLAFLGVVAASLASGLGEVTFLKYSAHFHKNVVSAWSSGTGGAGVLGAIAYAAITEVITPKATLLIMLFIPALLVTAYWLILEHPAQQTEHFPNHTVEHEIPRASGSPTSSPCCGDEARTPSQPLLSFWKKLRLVRPLLKYMIPLGLVYFAEYFINQGLTELITFDNGMEPAEQYRWYQVCYQVGVFVSRSSVNIVQIHLLWLFPILQMTNVFFFALDAIYRFVPSFTIVLCFIVYEGLLGGASYVNTFFKISQEVPEEHREFSMGVTSLADTLGITCSAFAAIYAHNAICSLGHTSK